MNYPDAYLTHLQLKVHPSLICPWTSFQQLSPISSSVSLPTRSFPPAYNHSHQHINMQLFDLFKKKLYRPIKTRTHLPPYLSPGGIPFFISFSIKLSVFATYKFSSSHFPLNLLKSHFTPNMHRTYSPCCQIRYSVLSSHFTMIYYQLHLVLFSPPETHVFTWLLCSHTLRFLLPGKSILVSFAGFFHITEIYLNHRVPQSLSTCIHLVIHPAS